MALDVLHFYCDCSSYTGDNTYAVVGGVAVKADLVDTLEAQIQALKDDIGMSSEFKWSSYKGGSRKRRAYHGLIDLMFDAIDRDYLHFHSLVVHFKKFDHHQQGRGSPHQSVNKLYFQLMLHDVCRRYGGKWRVLMFPDHGSDSEQIGRFREAICARAYKQYGAQFGSLRTIKPMASEKKGLLQMVDIAIGAMAAERESRALKLCKDELRAYFMDKSPVSNLAIDTDRDERCFTVWNFNGW